MKNILQLTANDGHRFDAYLAEASDPHGSVVVLQEIFGINHHIRSVADRFAREGFWAIAPALFNRVRPQVELNYDNAGVEEGKKIAYNLNRDQVLQDISAAIDYARATVAGKKVAVAGFCFGGSYAWLSATRLRPDAAICYYGSMIADLAQEKPICPVQMHFGKNDTSIPPSNVEKIRATHPECEIYLYDAGHGFSCDERESYAPEAAALAWSRALDFLKTRLAGKSG
ncbi:MAG TPA: dienelactone hydrolase family protein [Candidatus Methylacidiphilales bacterium]|nr:dienelactone hydrolase family protein [Candidatus Methylacidiphilales bacterium]